MIEVRFERFNDVLLCHVDGEISIKTTHEFDSAWKKNGTQNTAIIAINCENIGHIDSTGIHHLFKLTKWASAESIRLFYLDVPRPMKEFMACTNLNKITTVTTKENFEAEYLYR